MWTQQYDIIIETLTGSEFEITVSAKDTVAYIKSRIQKHEGIPISQQHLLYNQQELSDSTEMKDVPLVKGSRLKLVVGMKGGPVSARRVVTLPDYDRWFDLNDILNTSRQDPLTISTPNVKLLVYKDSKKNIHRVMKLRADRKMALNNRNAEVELPVGDHQDDQWLKDNISTMEKMHQLRSKLESQKKFKNSNQRQKQPTNEDNLKSKVKTGAVGAVGDRCINKKENTDMPKSTIGDGIYKTSQRIPFPPLKTATSAPTNLNHTNDYPYADRYGSSVGISTLNKHGLAKTCIRPPSLTAAQKQTRKSPTPPLAQDRSSFEFTDYFNVNSKLGNHYAENRTKIRDNIRRNRSFKAINFNDLIVEENSQQPKQLTFEELLCSNLEKLDKVTSAKPKNIDVLERPTTKSNSNNFGDKSDNQAIVGNSLFDNKFFAERQSYSLNGRDKRPCSGEFKIDGGSASNVCGGGGGVGGAIDSSIRVYKMTESNNCYELPKLLIREDSPVESFHSSDPQLETIALRGDSPKNVLDSFAKISTTTDGSLKADNSKTTTESILKSPWSHHHSDLGLNNLELNFLNDDLSDCEGASCLKKSNSVLKIASNLEINNWKGTNDFDRKMPPSMTELDFVTSDCESDDEENGFNNVCMHSNAKSKSVELNEFRMMFGSSPTLLNINPVTQTSFLDAVPFQYRRGYTNLNDACLSSSTSDLECFHSSDKKSVKASRVNGVGSSQEVSSLLRHRNNGPLDYVRSYENLDRAKIVRMKNEKRASNNGNGVSSASAFTRNDWKFHNHFERERVQEEDSGDDYSFSNLGYDNTASQIGTLPVGYQSNESLFNINFDSLDNSVFEIDKLSSMFEVSDIHANSSSLLLEEKCKGRPFLYSDLSNFKNTTTTSDKITDAPTNDSQDTTTMTTSSSNKATTIAKPTTPTTCRSSGTPKKSLKLRCFHCNKKLGVIMVMKCHCQNNFCAQHRYAEAHNCSYDFKQEGAERKSIQFEIILIRKEHDSKKEIERKIRQYKNCKSDKNCAEIKNVDVTENMDEMDKI
ncbi:AN1-type zinc finger protein 4, partial [Pseudolycoriella hygida]